MTVSTVVITRPMIHSATFMLLATLKVWRILSAVCIAVLASDVFIRSVVKIYIWKLVA